MAASRGLAMALTCAVELGVTCEVATVVPVVRRDVSEERQRRHKHFMALCLQPPPVKRQRREAPSIRFCYRGARRAK